MKRKKGYAGKRSKPTVTDGNALDYSRNLPNLIHSRISRIQGRKKEKNAHRQNRNKKERSARFARDYYRSLVNRGPNT